MKTHYYRELEREVNKHLNILERALRQDDYKPHKHIIDYLLAFSERLRKMQSPDVLIPALRYTCLNFCFFPKPYLSQAEIDRLEFD